MNKVLSISKPKAEKIIFKESYVSISFNEIENWLYILWQNDRTMESLILGAEKLLECVKTTRCTKIINDSSKSITAWPNLIDWFALDYALRLQEAGVQYLAWIYDDKNVIKLTADAILEKEKSDILVMVFDKLRTAETWMRAVR